MCRLTIVSAEQNCRAVNIERIGYTKRFKKVQRKVSIVSGSSRCVRRSNSGTRVIPKVAEDSDRSRSTLPHHQRIKLFSPCKINVFLRVINRREDGFHDLASLFQVIDLGDEIEVSIRKNYKERTGNYEGGDILTSNATEIPLDRTNLVIKAFEQFRKMSGRNERFIAHLHKNVPSGAGLGGGSANASTALFAANKLCDKVATEKQLQDWSGNVGSDCPVFFSSGAAYCTSRGEMVVDLKPPPLDTLVPILLVKPNVGLSTGKIFKSLDLTTRSKADPKELLQTITRSGACKQELCVNDLERPAFTHLPELENLKNMLQNSDVGFDAVFMSGSGSTIVSVGSNEFPSCLKSLDQDDYFICQTRFLSREEGKWYKE